MHRLERGRGQTESGDAHSTCQGLLKGKIYCPRHLFPEVESTGGIWVELDMVKSDTSARIDAAIKEHGGRIDVLVNNASYYQVGMIEDLS